MTPERPDPDQLLATVGCGEFTSRTNRERCGARCLSHPSCQIAGALTEVDSLAAGQFSRLCMIASPGRLMLRNTQTNQDCDSIRGGILCLP